MKSIVTLLCIVHTACTTLFLVSEPDSLVYNGTLSYPAAASLNVHAHYSGLYNKSSQRELQLSASLLKGLSASQLAHFFSANNWTHDQILSHHYLYGRNAFIKVANTLPGYPEYVAHYHEQYQSLSAFKKFFGRITGSYSPCLAARFAQLSAGCQTTLCLHRARTRAAYEHMPAPAKEEKSRSYYHERERALLQTQANNYQRTLCTFPVSENIAQFAQSYEINPALLERGMMTAYEKQLHAEFIEQLSQVHSLSQKYEKIYHSHSWVDMVVTSVWAGLQANAQKHPHEARLWASCGWYALDIAKAAIEGVVQAGKNTIDMVIHPIESVKAIAHGLGSLIMLAGRAVMPLAELHSLREAGRDEQADEAFVRLHENSKVVLNYCREELKKIGLRDVVKQGTAIAADIVISAQLLKAASKICSSAKVLSKRMLYQFKQEEAALSYAHGGAEKLLMESAENIPTHTPQLPHVPAVGGATHTRIEVLQEFHAQLMKSLEPEIARLRILFDTRCKGFAESANKYIKLAYEHVLGMELYINKKGVAELSGLHHDFMGQIERSGVIKFINKVMHKDGFYTVDILIEGNVFPRKTCFPSHWSREKVVNTIFEVYENFMKSGGIPQLKGNGKYLIQGTTDQGITIQMFITKNGKILTAYPLLI